MNPILTTFSTVPFSKVAFPTVTVDGGLIFDHEGYARKAWAAFDFPVDHLLPPSQYPDTVGGQYKVFAMGRVIYMFLYSHLERSCFK